MQNYELMPFVNGKAFIYFGGIQDGKPAYGNRICINKKGEKLFELPERDMTVNEYEPEDIAFVQKANGLYAVIDNKGKFLTDFLYNQIYRGIEEGFFEVIRNGKHGHIDITGREIIPCLYDNGSYFSEGLSSEGINGKFGMIDTKNNTVIPFDYEEIGICKNNLINAKKNGKYGLINKNNEIVADFIYDEIDIWCTRECLAYPARKGDKWGLIDRFGNVVEDFIYKDASVISVSEDNAGEFIFLYKDKRKAIYSAKKKEFITDFDYTYFSYLSDGRFFAIKDDKGGFINTCGDIVIPFIYDEDILLQEDFCEGRCVVYKDGKAGVIDIEGNVIVPFEYTKIWDCTEGMIYVKNRKGKKGFLNRNGEIVIPFGKYNMDYSFFQEGFAIIWDEKLGNCYINKKGEILKIKI